MPSLSPRSGAGIELSVTVLSGFSTEHKGEQAMMPLFDMMTNAQNGEAVKAMARQYGLSEDQVEQAMAALMPAFSTGLKRNASNPADVGNFLQALAGGNHARYFEDMQRAFTPQGVEEGNGILGHLFGSKEVSRAVAAQAASATGIGQEILKQMLPVLASMIMGGLFKQSTGQYPSGAGSSGAGNPGGSGNILGDLIGEMMRGGMAAGGQGRSSRGGPADNPFGQILEGMFGGAGRTSQGSATDPAGPYDNPLGQIFKDMMSGGQPAEQASTPQAEETAGTSGSPNRPDNPYDELFGQMFESGREVQQGYQKNVESIFDQFLEGMNRRS